MSSGNLERLAAAGVEIWWEGATGWPLQAGHLAGLVRDGVVTGAVVEPVALATLGRAIASGTVYDEQLRDLAAAGVAPADALLAVLAAEARQACDATGLASVGFPAAGMNADRLVSRARELADLVDRPNLLVRLPAGADGRTAMTELLGDGLGVHIGPAFSADDVRACAEAHLAGVDLAARRGRRPETVRSVVGVVLNTVDTETDKRLWAIATDESAALRGRTAVANARVVYAVHADVLAGWPEGARGQRLAWTGTSSRDPYYSETLYVDELVGASVVSVLSDATLGLVGSSSAPRGETLRAGLADARRTLGELAAVGVDVPDVLRSAASVVQARGDAAWLDLLDTLESRLKLAA